ncbi:YolD-like family protein [Paenibacillus sp. alder61]|uniref:YolD-like family protein n=1 Tax=Paenibacillus faecis TaxID=862114 RepID=A0A5D0CXV6_9BACL|nr:MULTISPECIES: YolD-like family protein [Paenibacillus]MCA1295406.1 YolD-like family protein [Paenibacillus sp. alder61]TYA14520.1 YolD-like family protein [Paenibacillus faecis]
MSTNKLTPGSNMLCESSRMILPEDKEAMLRAQHEEKRKSRPEIDGQLTEQISRFLVETHRAKQPVNLRMFDEFEDVRVVGVIERLDLRSGRFMVDGEWFGMADILELGFAPRE